MFYKRRVKKYSNLKKEIYSSLEKWLVDKSDCTNCKHFETCCNDRRHPCHTCHSSSNFEIAKHVDECLQDETNSLIKSLKQYYDNVRPY